MLYGPDLLKTPVLLLHLIGFCGVFYPKYAAALETVIQPINEMPTSFGNVVGFVSFTPEALDEEQSWNFEDIESKETLLRKLKEKFSYLSYALETKFPEIQLSTLNRIVRGFRKTPLILTFNPSSRTLSAIPKAQSFGISTQMWEHIAKNGLYEKKEGIEIPPDLPDNTTFHNTSMSLSQRGTGYWKIEYSWGGTTYSPTWFLLGNDSVLIEKSNGKKIGKWELNEENKQFKLKFDNSARYTGKLELPSNGAILSHGTSIASSGSSGKFRAHKASDKEMVEAILYYKFKTEIVEITGEDSKYHRSLTLSEREVFSTSWDKTNNAGTWKIRNGTIELAFKDQTIQFAPEYNESYGVHFASVNSDRKLKIVGLYY